jgi:tetratricopeptide (TPR) repeat protein
MHRRVGTTDEHNMMESTVRGDAGTVGDVLDDQVQAANPPDAAASDPEDPELLHSSALIFFEAAQFDQAVELASRAIRKDPKPVFLTTLGAALLKLRRHDDALKVLDKAVQIKPDDGGLWWSLGTGLIESGRPDEALLCFQRTLELDPDHADAAYKAGHLLCELGRLDEAFLYLSRSTELNPDHGPAWQVRAVVLKRLNRLDEALADNERALRLDPANADTCGNMGNVLQTLGRHEDALTWYDRSLDLRPNIASATNKAMSLTELARFDEAVIAYRKALDIAPGHAIAVWNLSLLQLAAGDFEAGWRAREARWGVPELAGGYPQLSIPMWRGEESVAGKTVVVCQDEGLGDAIQFARYIPLLAARGARVILVVGEALCPLLERLDGVSRCLAKKQGMAVPPFDLHVAIGSLPLAFGTRLDSIPSQQSYLPRPDADRVQAWEHRLGPREKLRVGLAWSGNPNFRNDHNRSMPLEVLGRLLDLEATFVSLQKDTRPQDVELLGERTQLVDHTACLTDFRETAALVSCLDLVITVDTSIAHLAGALGCRTWVLLPYVSDWRWLRGRDDSPWYPTVRLFRQTDTREYGSVIERVRDEMLQLIRAAGKPAECGGNPPA